MVLMRRLTLKCMKMNFFISGKNNTAADLLPRLQIQRFRELVPQANQYPTKVPPLPT